MKIEKVTIKNFKSIQYQEIDLYNYNVFVGENNSGKSNFIAALRAFYDEYKPTTEDFCIHATDNEMYIELKFDLIGDDITKAFFEEKKGSKYLLEDDKLVVRRDYVKDSSGLLQDNSYHGFLQEEQAFDTDNQFFGTRRVSKSMLGEIIYIPPLTEIGEALKTSSKYSTIMKLVNKIVQPKLKDNKNLQIINNEIQQLNETSPFEEIEQNINTYMLSYSCEVQMSFDSLSVDNIFSNIFMSVKDSETDFLPVANKGMGLQRALLMSLLKYWAAVEKESKPDTPTQPPSLLIVEEPEVHQHPQKQSMLFDELKNIAKDSNQVFITTHSSNFVSEADDDLRYVFRTMKNVNDCTEYLQVKEETIDKSKEADRFKFWKYLDAEKNKIFFSNKTVLCEGNTERLLANYIIKSDAYVDDFGTQSAVTLIDCCGKYNLVHFIRICEDLHINYSIFYDLDTNKKDKKQLNEDVNEAIKNLLDSAQYLVSKHVCDDNLDISLFQENISNDQKMNIIERIEEGNYDTEVYDKLKSCIKELVEA
ncbi:MAG: ATP-dependent nuclease [Patescibacteria group bacterium]